MHGPTCIFWVSLTPSSRQHWADDDPAAGGADGAPRPSASIMGYPIRAATAVDKMLGRNSQGQPDPGHGNSPHVVCSAVVYDDLLRQVRVWTRLGHTPEQIQGDLDFRYGPLLDVMQEVSDTE